MTKLAVPLAQLGHKVTISDISSAEVELASQKVELKNASFEASVISDARSIQTHKQLYRENHFDLVLCFGPLYHILDQGEQAQVVLDCLKICQPGGYVALAFVSKNAHLRDIAVKDPQRLQKEAEFYHTNGYLSDGKYTRGRAPMHHTTIPQIRELLLRAQERVKNAQNSFAVEKMISCEGFLGFQHASHLAKLDDQAFSLWLNVILETAEDETTLGCADHVLVILRKT